MGVLDGLFDGFPFKSREQVDKEERDFQKRVFPLGLAQRDAALAVLRELLTATRVGDTERLFTFISAKDAYSRADDPAEGEVAARGQLAKIKWAKGDNEKLILALIRLDTALETLENYPTAAQVREAAGL